MKMRWIAIALLVGCAAQGSLVRDPDGNPLPTSARLDADAATPTVRCHDRSYAIIEPPPPYLSGTHFSTHVVHVRDAAALCAKIVTAGD